MWPKKIYEKIQNFNNNPEIKKVRNPPSLCKEKNELH